MGLETGRPDQQLVMIQYCPSSANEFEVLFQKMGRASNGCDDPATPISAAEKEHPSEDVGICAGMVIFSMAELLLLDSSVPSFKNSAKVIANANIIASGVTLYNLAITGEAIAARPHHLWNRPVFSLPHQQEDRK